MAREPRHEHQFYRKDRPGDQCWEGSRDFNQDVNYEKKKTKNEGASMTPAPHNHDCIHFKVCKYSGCSQRHCEDLLTTHSAAPSEGAVLDEIILWRRKREGKTWDAEQAWTDENEYLDKLRGDQ
jgi:hypothetical protein